MIANLTGKLSSCCFTECIIDVNGVGYQVFIPLSTFDQISGLKDSVSLKIHTLVREDAISLYGFFSEEEKKLFEILIGVSGVGAKLALSILSSMPVSSFCNAIKSADLAVIKRISGIGKRTAERLILELKDKVVKISPETKISAQQDHIALAAEDACLALEQLGFKRESAQKALQKIAEDMSEQEASSENFIRRALQMLNGG